MSEDLNQRELTCQELQLHLRTRSEAGLGAQQLDHLASCDACMDALLLARLAAPSPVEPSPDFASRLCASLPELPASAPAPAKPRVSRISLVAAFLLLCCVSSVLYAFSPSAWLPQGVVGVLIGYSLLAEVVGLALWLGAPQRGR